MAHPQYCVLDIIAGGAAVAATVVASVTPGHTDMSAVLGAVLASAITVLEARKSDRTLGNTVSVFIASATVGSIAPGAVLGTAWPDLASRFTWQAWAGLGFFCGLLAWSLVLAVLVVANRRIKPALDRFADRFAPDEPPSSAPPGEHPEGR